MAPSLATAASVDAMACGENLAQPLASDISNGSGLSRKLDILIWNIQKAQNTGWESDLSALGANTDLVLIQEASVQAMLSTALPQPLHEAFAAGYTNNTQETGVLTLSAVAPSLHCSLTAWEPWLGTPKATNITEYPIAGMDRRLLVINLHAINFALGLSDFELQITALEPLLARHIGPLLVAGDFNTWNGLRSEFLQKFMLKYQLHPVQFTPDQRTRFLNQPLDHVYLRDLNLLQAGTVVVDSSDHNPLLMTVEIPLCTECSVGLSQQPCPSC